MCLGNTAELHVFKGQNYDVFTDFAIEALILMVPTAEQCSGYALILD